MNIIEIIKDKRDGKKLTKQQIDFFIQKLNELPDYQISSLLMAIYFNGMNYEETTYLTQAMTKSGKVLDLSEIKQPKIDKHSTGGVGDGTSLVLAPLLASCGICVGMMSGRGLAHTGGTLDKLESIPGFNVYLSEQQIKKQLKEIGCGIFSQTPQIAPADKKLYALRDVTCTVDSIPLIASSIISKKLAEGCDGLVLDVKTGSGAFMKKLQDAKKLAKIMVEICKRSNKKCVAIISNMQQPLGSTIGNALEIKQAIKVLSNQINPQFDDFRNLVLYLGSWMLILGKKTKNLWSAEKTLKTKLANGEALKKFKKMISSQRGKPEVVDLPDKFLPKAEFSKEIKSNVSGYIEDINTYEVGISASILGAGRITVDDKIDYSVGIIINKKIGDFVNKNDTIAKFYYNEQKKFFDAQERFLNAIKFSKTKTKKPKLILEVIK